MSIKDTNKMSNGKKADHFSSKSLNSENDPSNPKFMNAEQSTQIGPIYSKFNYHDDSNTEKETKSPNNFDSNLTSLYQSIENFSGTNLNRTWKTILRAQGELVETYRKIMYHEEQSEILYYLHEGTSETTRNREWNFLLSEERIPIGKYIKTNDPETQSKPDITIPNNINIGLNSIVNLKAPTNSQSGEFLYFLRYNLNIYLDIHDRICIRAMAFGADTNDLQSDKIIEFDVLPELEEIQSNVVETRIMTDFNSGFDITIDALIKRGVAVPLSIRSEPKMLTIKAKFGNTIAYMRLAVPDSSGRRYAASETPKESDIFAGSIESKKHINEAIYAHSLILLNRT